MSDLLHPGQIDDGTGCPNCRSHRWDEHEQYCSWCGYEAEDNWDGEDTICDYCSGTGGEPYDDFCTPCPVCDGEGYKWWL